MGKWQIKNIGHSDWYSIVNPDGHSLGNIRCSAFQAEQYYRLINEVNAASALSAAGITRVEGLEDAIDLLKMAADWRCGRVTCDHANCVFSDLCRAALRALTETPEVGNAYVFLDTHKGGD